MRDSNRCFNRVRNESRAGCSLTLFIYLKRAALKHGEGSIEPRTVCLLMVFLRATIELTWSRTRRGIRATASLTCIKIQLNRSPRYAECETLPDFLNNLLAGSCRILEIGRWTTSFIGGGNADNPNGWIERGINVDFVIIRPYREPSMGILTVFSQPPTGIELIAFSLFRIRCSADRCSWDERRKIK